MTLRLFTALYIGLIVGMFVLFLTNFTIAWIFFLAVFVAIFGPLLFGIPRWLLAVFFLVPSVATLALGAIPLAPELQAATWPATSGTIVGPDYCNRQSCLTYQYWVNGERYTGGELYGFDDGMSNGLRNYGKGGQVTVHNDPQQPRVSRFIVGFTLQDGGPTVVGSVMTLLSAAALAATQVEARQKKAPGG